MFLWLEGREAEAAILHESALHPAEDGPMAKRLLVSILTHTPEEHGVAFSVLRRARMHGIESTDGAGHITGKWRVVDNPVNYRMGRLSSTFKLVFELEKMTPP